MAGARPYTGLVLDLEIPPAEAATLLKEATARIVDVRESWEFAVGHIEGSLPMPMGEVPSRACLELDPGERLIVVCHLGMRSLNVAVWLRNHGFDQVQSLRGGIDAWSAQVDPKVARY